jgi:HJR/Mrr/RecB family endonuclease
LRDLPDVDLGDQKTLSLIRISDLRADDLHDRISNDIDEVVFSGELQILRGGTLPHNAFRVLVAEGLPLGGGPGGSAALNRCSLTRDHASEESLLPLVSRVIKQATRALLEIVANDPILILEVEHRDVERILASAAEDLGFDVELTRAGKDGGKDLVLQCRDADGRTKRYYVEIKHWISGKKVGPRELQDLLEVVVRDGANGGLFISTSGFNLTARQLASTPEVAELMRLVDQKEMILLIREFAHANNQSSLPIALLADIVGLRS